jgi:AcrR family transcriptional regulator
MVRAERLHETRELIMTAAERLFAEHGVIAVSSRQIGEAAGQGNTAAVGYHFGTKTGLVRAIIRKHTDDIERIRARMAAQAAGSADLRDWVACLVRPSTEHLAALGGPTWFARFGAQVMTDPVLRTIMIDEALGSPATHQVLDGLNRCLAGLPARVRAERDDMAIQLYVHMIAELERAFAEGVPTPRANWRDAATGLIDAIVGLYLAAVTPSP